jgi:hypothetical protein
MAKANNESKQRIMAHGNNGIVSGNRKAAWRKVSAA